MIRMTLREPKISDIAAVADGMRDRDFAEFQAVFGRGMQRANIGAALVGRYLGRKDVFSVWAGEAPVAIAGFLELRPRVITLLLFATPEIESIGLPFTRKALAMIAEMEGAGAHRIECVSLAGYIDMHRWLKTVGMRPEATHKAWGANGEDFISFARVKS